MFLQLKLFTQNHHFILSLVKVNMVILDLLTRLAQLLMTMGLHHSHQVMNK